jgi:hypothetical protein
MFWLKNNQPQQLIKDALHRMLTVVHFTPELIVQYSPEYSVIPEWKYYSMADEGRLLLRYRKKANSL